jgi:PAT family beta-lactamase induction signal transducer AmpG
MVVLVLPLLLIVPCPPADGRLAHESFREFARDLVTLLKRPSVLWTLLLFVAPAASFALTNILGGLGRDFHTSEQMVGLIGGAGVAIAGVAGSLTMPALGKFVPPRPLYLWVGGVGALFSFSLVALGHGPVTFGLAMLGENVFQAASFAVAYIIILRSIGHDNPLAATQFGVLLAAGGLPLSYMQVLDGQAYGWGGVNGSYMADALVSGGASALLGLLLWVMRKHIPPI